jgi:cytidylate kinase
MSDVARTIIAIDGAAGSGKSTLARGLAKALDLPYVNTGSMYRALAAAAGRAGVEVDDAAALLDLARGLRFRLRPGDPAELEVEGFDEDVLTTSEVESTVSAVARHPAVRSWMCDEQRRLGANGAVMEGRDISTVVFPDAEVKLFLQADPVERATRRADERPRGPHEVEEALRQRDDRDARTTPLEPTQGAIVLDTGSLGIDETLAEALRVVAQRVPPP